MASLTAKPRWQDARGRFVTARLTLGSGSGADSDVLVDVQLREGKNCIELGPASDGRLTCLTATDEQGDGIPMKNKAGGMVQAWVWEQEAELLDRALFHTGDTTEEEQDLYRADPGKENLPSTARMQDLYRVDPGQENEPPSKGLFEDDDWTLQLKEHEEFMQLSDDSL
ncbi:uncharacterized protein AB675_5818 [Cyphellophora attinorum]|uniref:Uncharacterized protein n=1 Tax=Cyphellophora attinorum TaxID=1664694 RepID=A0A0N1HN79_9EURO|nr:uncharacterized protein AB675_5818 [Phialophora attinorum]KPI38885.1 hypothetical protein AB675_5818 [Phialophora attinorum]